MRRASTLLGDASAWPIKPGTIDAERAMAADGIPARSPQNQIAVAAMPMAQRVMVVVFTKPPVQLHFAPSMGGSS